MQSGWITSLFAPYRNGFYVAASRIAEKKGKVTLVVTFKDVGKTNLRGCLPKRSTLQAAFS